EEPSRKRVVPPLDGLPNGAKVLGRASGDAWAVLRVPRATSGDDVVLWDASQRKIARTLPDVGAVPDFVALTFDGRRMAYRDLFTRKTVRLWDWERNRF